MTAGRSKSKANDATRLGFQTSLGSMYIGKVEDFLASDAARRIRGRVNLIFTSPPFPLNRKKKYGNEQGEEYLRWLSGLAPQLSDLLSDDGSIVIEVGNAWEPGLPEMSTLALRSLLAFQDAGELRLCQQFICHNPQRLPGPTQYVNIDRIRVKDTFTHVWWLSRTSRPKADNRKVLTEYSPAMKKLLERQTYNAGVRPSEWVIGEKSFLQDNGGAIPSNVLTFGMGGGLDDYAKYCAEHGIQRHPARMQPGLVEFFLNLLTDPGDLVFDPFGGSNTTGAVAERMGRKWRATEPDENYVMGAIGRFQDRPGLRVTSKPTAKGRKRD